MTTEKRPFGGKDDPMYEEAVVLVRANGRPSVSMIQRHFRIGWIRAATMLEAMVGTVIESVAPNAKILPEASDTSPHGLGYMQSRGAA